MAVITLILALLVTAPSAKLHIYVETEVHCWKSDMVREALVTPIEDLPWVDNEATREAKQQLQALRDCFEYEVRDSRKLSFDVPRPSVALSERAVPTAIPHEAYLFQFPLIEWLKYMYLLAVALEDPKPHYSSNSIYLEVDYVKIYKPRIEPPWHVQGTASGTDWYGWESQEEALQALDLGTGIMVNLHAD